MGTEVSDGGEKSGDGAVRKLPCAASREELRWGGLQGVNAHGQEASSGR